MEEQKNDIQQAAVQHVQNIYGTQININRVDGHYIEHVDTLIIGTTAGEKKEERKKHDVEALFGNGQRNRREAERFNRFLTEEGLADTPLDSALKNPVNKAFVAMYRYWMEQDVLPEQPNGCACYRFLKDDCGLTLTKDSKTYANFIRRAIEEADDDRLGDMPGRIRKAYKA